MIILANVDLMRILGRNREELHTASRSSVINDYLMRI